MKSFTVRLNPWEVSQLQKMLEPVNAERLKEGKKALGISHALHRVLDASLPNIASDEAGQIDKNQIQLI